MKTSKHILKAAIKIYTNLRSKYSEIMLLNVNTASLNGGMQD
jgi:hypothetical protein